jgi:hypothetical protein
VNYCERAATTSGAKIPSRSTPRFEGAFGYTQLSIRPERAPQVGTFSLATQECLVGAEDVACLFGILFQQLNSEVAEAGGTEFLEISGTCLGNGIEEGIPAADIGTKGMLHPDTVAQVHTMGLTGTAAVGVILSAGEECRKDAMLHVKHRHVLMERELEPLGRSRFE